MESRFEPLVSVADRPADQRRQLRRRSQVTPIGDHARGHALSVGGLCCSNGPMADMSDIERLARLGDLVSPMAVRVAATLHLCDHVADGATTAPVLAELTGTHADTLGRLMRHLVAIGVMSCSGEHYALTEIGESMREGRTSNRGPLTLDVNSAVGRANLASVKLLESVRTGGPAYPLMYGRGFWEDLAANPGWAPASTSSWAPATTGSRTQAWPRTTGRQSATSSTSAAATARRWHGSCSQIPDCGAPWSSFEGPLTAHFSDSTAWAWPIE